MERDELEDQNWQDLQDSDGEDRREAPGPSHPEVYEFRDWALI